jgi:hypothetical protein
MNKFIPYPQKFKDIDKKSYDYAMKMKTLKEQSVTDEKAKQEYERELALQELEDNKDNLKDGYNSGGYDWCIQNWGTKWNFCDVDLNETNPKELKYSFQTAWSVPQPILFMMSKLFPKLEIHYFGNEESEAFEYEVTFKKGKIVEEEMKEWADIQIQKIYDGEWENYNDDDKLQEEINKHQGHKISYDEKADTFRCEDCNKIIWDRK